MAFRMMRVPALWLVVFLMSGCGQAMMKQELDALNARFDERLQINSATLPPILVGQPYSGRLYATGGRGFHRWKIVEGELPAGLVLDASSGTVTGTPTGEAELPLVVEVTDASGDPNDYVRRSVHFDATPTGS